MNVVANDPERTQGKNVIQMEKTFKQSDNSNADRVDLSEENVTTCTTASYVQKSDYLTADL